MFSHLYKTDKILVFVSTNLNGVDLLDEDPIKEHELGFVYLKISIGKKELFRVQDKHLVPIMILHRFISKADKTKDFKEIKNEFVD